MKFGHEIKLTFNEIVGLRDYLTKALNEASKGSIGRLQGTVEYYLYLGSDVINGVWLDDEVEDWNGH